MSRDVLLINPPFRLIPPFQHKLIDPPRNLALLATVLFQKDYSAEILDMPILGLNFDSIVPRIEDCKPKIVCVSNRSTYSFPIVQKVATIIKMHFPEIKIIVGGTYVSFAPVEALEKEPNIDFIVIGEGEITLPNLVEKILNNEDISFLKGIAFSGVNPIV